MTDTVKHKLTPQQYGNLGRLIDALESGKYTQARKQLRSLDDRYCCLGVACDLYDNTRWEPAIATNNYMGEHLVLPAEVRLYFGFPYSQGFTMWAGECAELLDKEKPSNFLETNYTLSGLNDAGRDFKEIANIIRGWRDTMCEVVVVV